MQHYAAFHLGLHCLPKYPFRGFQYTKGYGKCSKSSNTKKIIIFSAVRNFRNYVSEKVLVFVILECGL